MLIHGARAVLLRVKYDTGGFGQWVHRLAQRAPRNKVVVAIANKLARMAWAVLSSGKEYRHQPLPQWRPLAGRGKDAALGKHRTLSTFPPPRRRSWTKFHQGLLRREGDERTVQRRVGKPGCCKCVPSDRAIYKDRHARIIIKCPESDSPLRGRIHLRRLSLRPTSNLLQSGGGPYICNNNLFSQCQLPNLH